MNRVSIRMTLAGSLVAAATLPGMAQDKAPPAKPLPKVIIEQIADDEATPLESVKPRTVEEQKKIDARAWYGAGEVHLQREEYNKALQAFEKARDLDSSNAQVYRSIMEAALHLGNTSKALDSARKAVELDPDDFELLRQIAVEMIKDRKVAEALSYLEKARNSPKLDKKSGFYVLINRDCGAIYNAIGEFDKAADCFEVVLAALLNPSAFGLDAQTRQELQRQRTTSFEEIGQILLKAKRIEPATQALERAVSERKNKPSAANFLLAQLYHEKGQDDKALEQINLFVEAQLRRGKAPYQLLAAILTKLGKDQNIVTRLEELAAADARNKDLQFFLAETYVSKMKYDEAEKIYKKSLEDSVSSEAYMGLAGVYRKQSKAKELLENLSRALERAGDAEGIAQQFETELKAISEDKKLFEALVEAHKAAVKDGVRKEHYAGAFLLAGIAADAEQIDLAVELFDTALKANPAQAKRVLLGKAEAQAGAKRYADASATYKQALQNPLLVGEKPDIYLRQSRVLAFAGKPEEALEAVNELKKLIPDPNHQLVLFQIAWIHYYAHHWDEARKGFEDLIQKHPDGGEIVHRSRVSLSNVYVQLGDTKKGEEILEKFLVETPDDPGVNNDLGYLYAEQGKNLEKAKEMIEKAVKAEPKNTAYLDSLGWVLFKLGKHDEALKWLQQATQQDREADSTIWDHLGDVQLQLKQVGPARESWERALKGAKGDTYPDEKLIKKIEEKLQLHKVEAK